MVDYNPMNYFGERTRKCEPGNNLAEALQKAISLFNSGNFFEAFDLFESMFTFFRQNAIDILEIAYEFYRQLPFKDRFHLYQGRYFNFNMKPGDNVLDIGSGNVPFPFATHLADFAVSDDHYGRAGVPFKYLEGKPVFECNVEALPFGDKEFDFVYCSHVLEHVHNPSQACDELMRIAKRGYIETPSRCKDLWLNTAKASNHKWALEKRNGVLIFTEYTPEEIEGLSCDLLMNMHCSPQNKAEKAFSALLYLKADMINTMLLWEDSFKYEIRRTV
jgi:SAM-dependent methyltransferase